MELTQYLVFVFKAFRSVSHSFGGLVGGHVLGVPVENVIEAARPIEA
jgi:hypothetical protein